MNTHLIFVIVKRLLACNGTGVDLNLIHWYCRHQKQERESLKEIPSRGRARKLTHKGQHGNPLLIRLYNREKNSFLKEKKKSTTTTATTINYLKFAICYLHYSIAFRKKRALHEHKLPIWKTLTINQYSNSHLAWWTTYFSLFTKMQYLYVFILLNLLSATSIAIVPSPFVA